MLAASSQDGTVILWDPKTGEQIGSPLEGPYCRGPVAGLAFSPDGSTLAAGYTGGSIRLWNPRTGDVKGEALKPPLSEINVLDFSPDSATLASGSIDWSVALWDVQAGQQIGGILDGYGVVWGLDSELDGLYLASGGSNGSTYLRDRSAWSEDPAPSRAPLCLVAARNLTRVEWARFLPFANYHATCPEYAVPPPA